MYIKCTPTCNNHCYQCQNFWLWPFLSFYLLLLIILIILQVVDQMLTGTCRWISRLCLYSLLCFCSWWNELFSSFLYVSEPYFLVQSWFVCIIDKLFVLSLCLCQVLHYVCSFNAASLLIPVVMLESTGLGFVRYNRVHCGLFGSIHGLYTLDAPALPCTCDNKKLYALSVIPCMFV